MLDRVEGYRNRAFIRVVQWRQGRSPGCRSGAGNGTAIRAKLEHDEVRRAPPEEALEVFDVSIRGIGIVTSGSILGSSNGDVVAVRVDLGRYGIHEMQVTIRHVGAVLTGCELEAPSAAVTTALGRYLAELLERGAFS